MLAKITAPFTENSAGFVDVNQSAETHESLEKSIRRGRKENSVQAKIKYPAGLAIPETTEVISGPKIGLKLIHGDL